MNALPDPERRFGGIARLYGAAALVRLRAAHVCVVGIGGVGSWSVEALARSGVGRLTLVDLDHVAESNINRQIHALESTLGQAKVVAMAERVGAINPDCQVDCIEEFAAPDNVDHLLPACDGLIDAIDQARAKAALIAWAARTRTAIVTIGAAGGRIDPLRIRADDLSRTTQDALAAKVRALLRREYGYPRDPKRVFGVDCIHSHEPRAIGSPDNGSDCAVADPAAGLSCAGYGSSVMVTASFGFAAAARMIEHLLRVG